jgi:hypothetical protein
VADTVRMDHPDRDSARPRFPWAALAQLIPLVFIGLTVVLAAAAVDAVPEPEHQSPTYDALWSAFWWSEVPLIVQTIVCMVLTRWWIAALTVAALVLTPILVVMTSPGAV